MEIDSDVVQKIAEAAIPAIQSQMTEIMALHEKQMADYQQRFAATVSKGIADMEQAQRNYAAKAMPEEPPKPACEWVKTKDGEEVFVMNKAAQQQIEAIFDAVQVLASKLKQANQQNQR